MGDISTDDLCADEPLLHCRSGCRTRGTTNGKEAPLTDVISRHVKQVADYNKVLEKRHLWREREKELERKRSSTCGVLRAQNGPERRCDAPGSSTGSSSAKRVLESIEVEGMDEKIVDRVKEKVARAFGSFDAHAAMRQRAAKLKEKRQLQMQNEAQDAWMPDRFYTIELKQKTPWLNPVQFLSELQQQRRSESLTPVASDSDTSSKKRDRKKAKRKKHKKDRKHGGKKKRKKAPKPRS